MWIRRKKYQELNERANLLLDEVCSLRGSVARLQISKGNLEASNKNLRKRCEELEVALRYADDPYCDD